MATAALNGIRTRGPRHRWRLPKWLVPFLLVGLILLLPLVVPIMLVVLTIEKRRLRTVARSFACVNCHSLLGLESLRLADKEWREHLEEMRRRLGWDVRLRILRTLHAICSKCGTRYTFDKTK